MNSPFKPKWWLEAEKAALRRQLMVLRCQARGRIRFANLDRLFLVELYRRFPSILRYLPSSRRKTNGYSWCRAGCRRYWRWISRSRRGQPQIDAELRAPRISGELLKLGFAIGQSTVAKCMVKRWGPHSQGWRTFLCNHVPEIAAADLFVVPTTIFSPLYANLIVWFERRELVWIKVTQNPTAEGIACQLTEAFPWDDVPGYLVRDDDLI